MIRAADTAGDVHEAGTPAPEAGETEATG